MMSRKNKSEGKPDNSTPARLRRRRFGEHLTPIDIFERLIAPDALTNLYSFRWVDMFAGAGNLILPILSRVPPKDRCAFFVDRLFLFDIQPEMVERAVQNATHYGIPESLARENIRLQDTLKEYPESLIPGQLPLYHITNPPYLYLGYIAKHAETQSHLQYFTGANSGYQDLYQLAMMNDLRHQIGRMVYIIPSNFLFSASGANKIRNDFLPYYNIRKTITLESEVFEHTGANVMICFFQRKSTPIREPLQFESYKVQVNVQKRIHHLKPANHYRAGSEFEEFVQLYKARKPLKIRFHFMQSEVEANLGDQPLEVLDANRYEDGAYKTLTIHISDSLKQRVLANRLFIRTVDTGSLDGRAGLYLIEEAFGVQGILVTKSPYRTHPIHLFIEPALPEQDLLLLRDYVNLLLEHFRAMTDSEFLTTYKYSASAYTRKYLGLSQAKALIETCPLLSLSDEQKVTFQSLVANQEADQIVAFVKELIESFRNF